VTVPENWPTEKGGGGGEELILWGGDLEIEWLRV